MSISSTIISNITSFRNPNGPEQEMILDILINFYVLKATGFWKLLRCINIFKF